MSYDLISEEINSNSLDRIKELKKELTNVKESNNNNNDSDEILYKNIERAERFLDIIEIKVSEGNNKILSRLLEVATGLINAITTATTSIVGTINDNNEMLYKLELLELKNKELEIKSIIANSNKGKDKIKNVTNNLIVSDREDIMKMIQDQKEEKVE